MTFTSYGSLYAAAEDTDEIQRFKAAIGPRYTIRRLTRVPGCYEMEVVEGEQSTIYRGSHPSLEHLCAMLLLKIMRDQHGATSMTRSLQQMERVADPFAAYASTLASSFGTSATPSGFTPAGTSYTPTSSTSGYYNSTLASFKKFYSDATTTPKKKAWLSWGRKK